jgi:hypothetical protein
MTPEAPIVAVGQNIHFQATVLPLTADPSLLWSSDRSDIASVGADGTVTGLAPGEASIRAASASKPEVQVEQRVTVYAMPTASTGAPGMPVLSNDNGHDTGLLDGFYRIKMDMWWGNNGSVYRLYVNDALIDTQLLSDKAPQVQSTVTEITYRTNGTYSYYAELTNAYGTTRGAVHTVSVTQAVPSKPVLSHNNWDGDGNFTVSMNLWWGTNGTQYQLYENGVLLDTQTLTAATPQAQYAATVVQGKPTGTYEYVVKLANAAGTTSSDPIIVDVTQ